MSFDSKNQDDDLSLESTNGGYPFYKKKTTLGLQRSNGLA